jgi:mannosyltransferase OCH1-like enzyme
MGVPHEKSNRPLWHPSSSGPVLKKNRALALLLLVCSLFYFLRSHLQGTGHPRFDHDGIIPRKIWQSWKVDALSFEQRDSERARAWTAKNPNWRYEVLTDGNAISYVEQHFGPKAYDRPDIVATFKALDGRLRIIQSDLLRYIIMYVEGGLWADIDAEAIHPISKFIPSRFEETSVDMIIGIETDEPDFLTHPVLGSKALSFCQWTFLVKPGHPAMLALIENILKWLKRLSAESGKRIADLDLDFDEVLSGTGPSAFTRAILAHMTAVTGREVTWSQHFHEMSDSTLIGGTLVLPAEAFAAGTGHSRSGVHEGSRALVRHHFHASDWTSKHPRHKHPVYGEVERCNWKKECVALWDANIRAFAELPQEAQVEMIKNVQHKDGPKDEPPMKKLR